MIPILTFLIMVVTGATSRAAQDGYASPTLGVPADTFVTGCELILYGREVPPIVKDGRSGYWIVKSDREVRVNGKLCLSLDSLPRQLPTSPITPQVVRTAKVLEAAAEIVRKSPRQVDGAAVVEQEFRKAGEAFVVEVPEYGTTALVTLHEDVMFIEYDGVRVSFQRDRPKPVDPVEKERRRLDAAYWGTISSLKRGYLVLKGGNYAFFYPLSDSQEVRAQLLNLPMLVEQEANSRPGRITYKPVKIGGRMLPTGVIEDFLRP